MEEQSARLSGIKMPTVPQTNPLAPMFLDIELPPWVSLSSIREIKHPFKNSRANFVAATSDNADILISRFSPDHKGAYDNEKYCLISLAGTCAPRLLHSIDKANLLVREYILGEPLATVAASDGLLEQCIGLYVNTLDLRPRVPNRNALRSLAEIHVEALRLLDSSERRALHSLFRKLAFGPQVPCHRDFRPENVIVSGANIPFVIDFDFYGMDSPAVDVARFCLNPSLTMSMTKRMNLTKTFCDVLQRTARIDVQPDELIAGAYFWAIKSIDRLLMMQARGTITTAAETYAKFLEPVRYLAGRSG